jgi:hypothetical protein
MPGTRDFHPFCPGRRAFEDQSMKSLFRRYPVVMSRLFDPAPPNGGAIAIRASAVRDGDVLGESDPPARRGKARLGRETAAVTIFPKFRDRANELVHALLLVPDAGMEIGRHEGLAR